IIICLIARSREREHFTTDATAVTRHITRMEQMWEADIGQTPKALSILDATYGANATFVDVLVFVVGAVVDDRLDLLVCNDNLGGDPIISVGKLLKVTYAIDGEQGVAEVLEGQR